MISILENDELRVEILPSEGGRVRSLLSRSSGLEFLLQGARGSTLAEPGLHANFQDSACAGIDECLPTVGYSGDGTEGGPVPDHGDFWQLPWQIVNSGRGKLEMVATGFSRHLQYEKTISVHGSKLQVHSRVTNLERQPVSFLYACHPLFAVAEGDTIMLPDSVTRVRIHASRKGRLGVPEEHIEGPSPSLASAINLAQVLPVTSQVADMLYTDRLAEGWCGIYRAQHRQGIVLRFDPGALPYLGLWLCYGGWPEGADDPQYAVALEPTVAPHGTLQQAQQSGSAPVLDAGKSFVWTLCFETSRPGITLTEFREFCRGD